MATLGAGPIDPQALLTLLAGEPSVLIRVATDRTKTPPTAIHLRIEVPGGRWPKAPIHYPYPEIGFWIGTVTGTEAATWLANGASLPGGVAPLPVPYPSSNLSGDRHPSQSRSPWIASPWPFVRIDQRYSNNYQPQVRFLVGPGLPFFSASEMAIDQLIYGLQNTRAGSMAPGFRIDWQDRTARIGTPSIANDLIKVPVRGEHVTGLQLGLGGEHFSAWRNRPINRPSTCRFPLRNGIPDPLWIVLSKGSQWLDHRYLRQTPTGWHSDEGEVDFERPDLATQVRVWAAGWETDTLEFKANVTTDSLLEDVVAFANGDGGTILFGVHDQSRLIIGLSGNSDQVVNALVDKIHNKIEPGLDIETETCKVDGKLVLVATVSPGEYPPYGVRMNATRLTYYIRRGASNYEARPRELNDLVARKVTSTVAAQTPGFSGLGQL